MFIPFLYDEASIIFGKLLGFREILHFESEAGVSPDLFSFLTGLQDFHDLQDATRAHSLHECGYQKANFHKRACVRFIFDRQSRQAVI